jgi:hypothetical protein
MIRNWLSLAVLAGGLSLASCTTAPPPPPIASPVVEAAEPAPLPYRWTQGNAPQAYKDSVAAFGRLALKPGQYRWVTAMPEDGEARVVIDLLTQTFYVYRGEQLVGLSTMSSGKKGKETQLGFWAVMLKKQKGYSRKYDNAPMPSMRGRTPAIRRATAASACR